MSLFCHLSFGDIAWKKLFNGVDTTGWHVAGGDIWKIIPEDSAMEAKGNNLSYAMFFTDRDDFDQFTVKYSYRLLVGCSGFFFRAEETSGGAYVRGMHVEAKDGLREAGSIYCLACGGWMRQHTQEWSEGVLNSRTDYNQVVLTVKEPNVYVSVNGHQAVGETDSIHLALGAKEAWEYTGTEHINTPGRFGLQMKPYGGNQDIRFKNIEILQACTEGPNADVNLPEWTDGRKKQPAVYEHNEALCRVQGCTDPAASNHDLTAESDNGSCTYSGCAEPTAANYFCSSNPEAYPCLGFNDYTTQAITGDTCSTTKILIPTGKNGGVHIIGNQLLIKNPTESKDFRFEVFDVKGGLVHSQLGNGSGRYEVKLNMGIHLVIIFENGLRYSRRVLSI